MFRIDKKLDDRLYLFGWIAIGVILFWGMFEMFTGIHLLHLLRPCMFHLLTGYYCPGCGGTRAVRFLLQGRILSSFWYHPIVLYVVVIGGWFMLSQTIERMSRGRIRIGMHFREIYMWVALGIIIVNFVIKNLALIICNIDLLP